MRSTWSTVVRRVAELLGRRRTAHEEGGEEAESGFTLIELMVVLLIMGILMAIAIPTFLGVTNGANDRSTQSNLTNAMTSAKALYAQTGTFTTTTAKFATQMKKAEPELGFITGTTTASAHQSTLSVYVKTHTQLYLAAWMTKTSVCWAARDIANGTATVGVEYTYLVNATGHLTTTQANCKAATVEASTHVTWTRKWPISPAGH